MRTIPLTLAQANELIARLHRHHQPARGHRFSIGAERGGELVGASIVGRPVAMKTEQYNIAEVTRFVKIQTFILKDEPGTSLIAAGWIFEGMTDSKPHKWHSRPGRRTDQPSDSKQKWSKELK